MINDSEQFWAIVEHNLDEDVNRLRLKHHGDKLWMEAIDQIECRRRTARKLAQTLRLCPRFMFPSVLSSEQATSDTLAAYHARLVGEGKKVFDMTCGLGIDSMHFAANGCEVTACDINPTTALCAARNARLAGLDSLNVEAADSVERLMAMAHDSFDCIFIDPARRSDKGARLYALTDCQPDVTSLLDRMLEVAPEVIIKASPMLDISHTLAELHSVTDIMALGTKRECKELIIRCRRGADAPGQPVTVTAATVTDDGQSVEFSFHPEEESSAVPAYGLPNKGDFLYEPYPATVKAAPWKLLSSTFGIRKIAPNSHLYFSSAECPGFPGNGFEIIAVTDFSKKSVKELMSMSGKFDITCRNFPLEPSQLAKRLKIKQSGGLRLFATRDSNDRPLIIVGRKI